MSDFVNGFRSAYQGIMFDPDATIVTYDRERGEPRGARAKKVDYRAAGLGACVDCRICVKACPTGLDIREGFQPDCMGCSACIDGCNQVMDKLGYSRGLIRFSTAHALQQHRSRREILRYIPRPRILVQRLALVSVMAATVIALSLRQPLKVSVMRDRASPEPKDEDGMIGNVYRLQLMNTSDRAQRYAIAVTGLPGITLHHELVINHELVIKVPAASSQSIALDVHAPPHSGKHGSNKITFEIRALDQEGVAVREQANFFLP